NFIIGDAKRELISSSQNRFLNLFLALFLFALFLPVFLLLYFYHLLSPSERYFCTQEMFSSFEIIDLVGTSEPKAFSLYLFNSKIKFFRKIPGLINVIKGDLCVVGNAPLTEEETKLITEKWQKLRFEAPIGLFHFWEVESKDEPTWEEKITMDNFYAQTRSFGLDLKILFKYFLPKF
ncbi:sugar transferase, partial [bacterium]|nr:sugar transferase [bacterium]